MAAERRGAFLHETLSVVGMLFYFLWNCFGTKPGVLHDAILGEICIALQFHEKSFIRITVGFKSLIMLHD